MTIKKPLSQWLKIIFFSLLVTIIKLRFKYSRSKKELIRKLRNSNQSTAVQQAFKGYAPTKHDVIVPIFPKSGTNWMMQITQQIAYFGDAKFNHIHDLIPWPDGFPTTVQLTDPTPQQKSPTGLRIIKSHLDSDFIPYSENATYILTIRDPKEVFVSAYHFGFGFLTPDEMLSIDEMFELLSEEGFFVIGDWAEHTHSYWKWRNRPNVLLMTYRELKRNPQRCIQKVADVMGVSLTDEQLDKIIAQSSVEHMKSLGFAFKSPLPPLPTLSQENTPDLIRSGRLNSAKTLLTQAQKDVIDNHWRKRLAEIGSDFPYDEVFVTNKNDSEDTKSLIQAD
ncbi:MAG: sulfotransferase domain-containing protein [Chloroflexota bacterium]